MTTVALCIRTRRVTSLTAGKRRQAGSAYSAVAAVFVRKAELEVPHPVEALAKRYELTAAKMRVLLAIVEIGGVPEVANMLGISQATVKTHLQRVFGKIPQGTTVPTIANQALLVAYSLRPNSVRCNRLARFVRDFFGRIDQFQDSARHPKWREINIAAEIPGWTRFKPARPMSRRYSSSWW